MRRRLLVVFGFVLAVGLLWTQTAQAYVIFGSWSGNSAGLDPDNSLPSSFFDGNKFGAQQWNLVTPSPWRFTRNDASQNELIYAGIDGSLGVLAQTQVFGFFNITEADITYDSAEDWYTGSGTPGPSQVDLRSIAVHELGHVTGLDHTQNSNCPGGSSSATMCPFYSLGTSYFRTLEADDRNGLNANYPRTSGLQGQTVIHSLYAQLSDQQLVSLATVALVGTVEAISPARWNSASGAKWTRAEGGPASTAYHEIRFRVDRGIRGAEGGTVTVTVFGASPAGSVDGSIGGRPDHNLGVGQRVLVLASTGSLTGSDGISRPILRFVGAPSVSYAAAGTARYSALLRLVG